MDKLAWSAWTSEMPGSACLPLCVRGAFLPEEKDEVREVDVPW